MVTALTVYETTTTSGTLSTACTLVATTGGSNSGNNTTCGTATGYSEIYAQGTSNAWAAAGSVGSASGHGFLWDVTTLEGQAIAAGNWTPTVRMKINAGTATADIIVRAFKRSSGGVYTQIGSNMSKTGQSFTTSSATFTFSAVSQPLMIFATGDKLYLDVWLNITANSSGSGTAVINMDEASSSTQGNVTNQVVTPGYSPATTTNKDITVRAKLSDIATKDITVRGRIGNTVFKDITTRAKLSAIARKDITTRAKLSAIARKDVAVRGRVGNTVFKDVTVRGRTSATVNKDITVRGKVSAIARKDITVRANVFARNLSGGCALWGNGTGTAQYDTFRVTQYPDPSVALLNAGRAANSLINHNGNFPNSTSVGIQTSTDNGVTWQANASGGADIAGITTLLYSTLVLQRKPSGYYHLGETVSPSLDSSGNGYSGTWHGTITPGQVGPLQGPSEITNTALLFDGSTAYIALASGLKTDGWSNLSVSVWFNTTASVGSATRLLANDNPSSTHNGIDLGLNASLAGCFFRIGNGTTSAVATFATTLSINAWYHLVGTWDGTTITIYLNGESQATVALSGSIGTAAQALAIGYNPATAGGFFKGSLAEVSLVNPTTTNAIAPLAAADVFACYNAGLAGIGQEANDSFTADTHTSYTSTNGSGGHPATWTWDTADSRLQAVGGSKAHLLYNNLYAYDVDILADFFQAENSGIVWGYQDASNYYSLNLKDSAAASGANTLTIFKTSAGTATQLATASVVFPTQTHHRLHLTMLSGVITAYLDENQILTYTDSSPFPAGLTGVRNDTGTSYIYLLQVTPQPVDVSSQFLCVKHTLSTTDPTVTPQITDHQGLVSDSTIGKGILIPQVDYRQTYVSDNIDDQNTQSNYWWSLGGGALTFQARNAKNASWILQSTDILTGSLPRVEYSGDLYRNEMVLKGVYQSSVYAQSFIGDGQSKTWNVANPVVSVPTITLNSQVQSVGIQGTDTGKAFYYQLNSTTITQDNSGTTLRKDIDVLSVAYSGAYGIDFTIDNTGQFSNTISQAQMAVTDGTSGIVSAIEDVSGRSMDVDAATTYANQLLQRYGSIARTITFVTLHKGLDVGHSLPIFVPNVNIFDSVFLVVEISTSTRSVQGGVQYVHTVIASDAAALSSWVKYFSKVMRSITGTKAKV